MWYAIGMNIFASFLGFGAPEVVFLLLVAAVLAVAFVIIKSFMKGYAGHKGSKTSADNKNNPSV